jgi:hypothetical protein
MAETEERELGSIADALAVKIQEPGFELVPPVGLEPTLEGF